MKQFLFKTISEVSKCVQDLQQDEDIKSLCILGTYNSELYKNFIEFEMSEVSKSIWGGFFPKVFLETEVSDDGIVVIGFKREFKVQVIKDISKLSATGIEKSVQELNIDSEAINTAMVLVDAFAGNLENTVEEFFNEYGLEFNYFGGGCGDLDFVQKPSVFTKEGLFQDGLVIATSSVESRIGVKHGWNSIAGPFLVTKASGNIIQEIDYTPAFDLYSEQVNKHSKVIIEKENFFEIAKAFPLGVPKLDSEVVVRDPLQVGENKELICVASVVENSHIYILNGTPDSLIASAKAARDEVGAEDIKQLLSMDCISRALFLEDDYTKELESVCAGGVELAGALVLGEIANKGKEFLEFYNKTIVVCRFDYGK